MPFPDCLVALIPTKQSVSGKALELSLAYSALDKNDFDLDKPYRMLQSFCQKHGIPCTNPKPAVTEAGASAYLKHDMHFSPEGQVPSAGRRLVSNWS